MPPKRKRRNSASSKGLAPGERLKRAKLPGHASPQWAWVGTEALAVTDITAEHRLLACGLSSGSQHPFCSNKYAKKGEVVDSQSVELSEDDVIIISDDQVHPCNPKSCKLNPNCLNYLGQEVWEKKTVNTFMKDFDLGHNPAEDDKKPGLPVGLKNLGATCYANAFLQVWYRDLTFRRAVYDCKPLGNPSDSPIFQLQATFAAMQNSIKSVYNPNKLIESLRLRSEEQQDAQEFSKLFITHLDSEFQKQDSPYLKKLITTQFQGTQVYTTACQTCGFRSESKSHFSEIELNLKNGCRLEERLNAYLEPEALTEDNRYLCPRCESLQDATRRIELLQLPPVLHLSLLRFVFDMSTLDRKKLKHGITFPLVLDMNQYLATPDMTREDNIYELRGILLHKGPSAYHGHYEVQVLDAETAEWFQFNDEVVTKIKSPGTKAKGKATGGKTKASSIKDKNVTPSSAPNQNDASAATSTDAYMLVYVKKVRVATADTNLKPTFETRSLVQADNAAHAKAKELYTVREEFVVDWLKDLRLQVMRIYQSWNVNSIEQDSILASRSALNHWFTQLPRKYSFQQSDGATADALAIEGKDICLTNEDIVCSHNLIDPLRSENIKHIDKAVYVSMMESNGWKLSPVLTPADLCHQCIKLQFKERLYHIQHPKLVAEFHQLAEENDLSAGYWISKSWVKDWKLTRPRMHIAGQDDPPPDSPEFLPDILCEHNRLQPAKNNRAAISKEARDLLQTSYPNWDPPSVHLEPCSVCEASEGMQRECKREVRKKAEEEKSRLRYLYDGLQSRLTNDGLYALVDTDFAKSWREWVDHPSDVDRPEIVDTSKLLCIHNLSPIDFNAAIDLPSVSVMVERHEWDVLQKIYQTGPAITLEITEDKQQSPMYTTEPPLCLECAQQRSLEWRTTTIAVIRIAKTRKGSEPEKSAVYGSNGRHTRHLRRTRGIGAKIRFDVDKSTTVKDIMVKIQQEWKIPTICQKLAFKAKALEDGAATMEELGMYAHGLLQLTRLDEVHNLDSDFDDGQLGPREEGHAFAGTLLGSSQPSVCNDTSSPSFNEKKKSCLACTYMNDMDAVACMMCDTLFVEQ